MILVAIGYGLFEVKLAMLKPFDPSAVKPRCFSSSEQLISFLKDSPSVKFILSPMPAEIGSLDLISVSDASAYGPQFGDVLCGIVSYNPAKGQVLTVGTYVDDSVQGLWSG